MYYDPREQQKNMQQQIKIAQSNAAVTPIAPTSPLSAPHMQKGMMQETTEDFGKKMFTKILTTMFMNTGGPIGAQQRQRPYDHNPKAWTFGDYDHEAGEYERVLVNPPLGFESRALTDPTPELKRWVERIKAAEAHQANTQSPYDHNPKAWTFGDYDHEAGEYERVMVNPPLGFKSAAEHKMQMKEYEIQKAQERADKAAAAKERRAEEAHAAKLAREAIKESGMVRNKTMPFQKPPAIMTTYLGSREGR